MRSAMTRAVARGGARGRGAAISASAAPTPTRSRSTARSARPSAVEPVRRAARGPGACRYAAATRCANRRRISVGDSLMRLDRERAAVGVGHAADQADDSLDGSPYDGDDEADTAREDG